MVGRGSKRDGPIQYLDYGLKDIIKELDNFIVKGMDL